MNAMENKMPAEEMADKRTDYDMVTYGIAKDKRKDIYEVELLTVKRIKKYTDAGTEPGVGQFNNISSSRDIKFKEIMTAEQYSKFQGSKDNERKVLK